jgi:tetratricopeptide (TPR) repeat protein
MCVEFCRVLVVFTPFSLADLGLSDEEIAALNASEQPAAPVSEEPEMTPFSLADLGLSDEEIASLEAPQAESEPSELGLDPELTPFSLAELGLTEDDIASLNVDDERSLGLSAEELDHLDLALPTPEPLTIEPGPVWEEAQQAVDEVVAAERAEHEEPAPAYEEPEMTPFSLADLGLSDEEIAELNASEQAAASASEEPEMTPFSLTDLGLSDEEIATFEGAPEMAPSNVVEPARPSQPEPVRPSQPEPATQGVPAAPTESPRTTRPLYDVSPRPAQRIDRPRYGVSPRPTPQAEPEAEAPAAPQPEAPVRSAQPAQPAPVAAAASSDDMPDLSDYQQQLAADPNNVGLRLALARMMGQTNQVDAAMSEYKRLIKQGQLLDQIVEDIQDLIETNEEATLLQRLHRALGDAYSKQGRWREAMEEYSWVLAKPRH